MGCAGSTLVDIRFEGSSNGPGFTCGEDGVVKTVADNSQAKNKGVQVGWTVQKFDGVAFNPQVYAKLDKKIKGEMGTPYKVSFQDPKRSKPIYKDILFKAGDLTSGPGFDYDPITGVVTSVTASTATRLKIQQGWKIEMVDKKKYQNIDAFKTTLTGKKAFNVRFQVNAPNTAKAANAPAAVGPSGAPPAVVAPPAGGENSAAKDSKIGSGSTVEGELPMLPAQLPEQKGSWQWIRFSNGPEDRRLRMESYELLNEAFVKGGYTMRCGGKETTVRFSSLDKLVAGTEVINYSDIPKSPAESNADQSAYQKEMEKFMRRKDLKDPSDLEYGGHPIEKAAELTLQGSKVVVVSAASAYHAGGGFTSGGRHALEEALCSQTTLYHSLKRIAAEAEAKPYKGPSVWHEGRQLHAHIPVDGAILSPHVEFFRRGTDVGYPCHPQTTVIAGVVSIAMFNKNRKVKDAPCDAPARQEDYQAGVRRKFEVMLAAAARMGADAIIVPDVGCGVFENDPTEIGALAGQAFEKYGGYFKRVLFTGKHEFFAAASQVLLGYGKKIKRALADLHESEFLRTLKPQTNCLVCGQPLRIAGKSRDQVCILLQPTGKRTPGLEFIHSKCENKLADAGRPGHPASKLPDPEEYPEQYLRAFDVDGNLQLQKHELRHAIQAISVGELQEAEFEEEWGKLLHVHAYAIEDGKALKVGALSEVPDLLKWVKAKASGTATTMAPGPNPNVTPLR
jgi:uncharacterized protein (TIGR02452 family)